MNDTMLDYILGNQEFLDAFNKGIEQGADWLLNYEYPPYQFQDEKGGTGTVYSTHTSEGQVFPTIMLDDNEQLQLYPIKDAKERAESKSGYMLDLGDEESAEAFNYLLHLLHQVSGETKSSYETKL
jgi:hypothetical protein